MWLELHDISSKAVHLFDSKFFLLFLESESLDILASMKVRNLIYSHSLVYSFVLGYKVYLVRINLPLFWDDTSWDDCGK